MVGWCVSIAHDVIGDRATGLLLFPTRRNHFGDLDVIALITYRDYYTIITIIAAHNIRNA